MITSQILGILGSAIAILAFVPYLWHMYKGTTKPHTVSWFLWGLLQSIAFFAQVSRGAGAGAWITAVTALFCLLIAWAAFSSGEITITRGDRWVSVGAVLAIIGWQLTRNPLTAVVLVTFTDALAFVPTYRKGYHKPHEETALQYALSALRSVFSIAALESFSLTTALYPASIMITDGVFVLMLLVRRGSKKQNRQ